MRYHRFAGLGTKPSASSFAEMGTGIQRGSVPNILSEIQRHDCEKRGGVYSYKPGARYPGAQGTSLCDGKVMMTWGSSSGRIDYLMPEPTAPDNRPVGPVSAQAVLQQQAQAAAGETSNLMPLLLLGGGAAALFFILR